jgi:hypothetical protein
MPLAVGILKAGAVSDADTGLMRQNMARKSTHLIEFDIFDPYKNQLVTFLLLLGCTNLNIGHFCEDLIIQIMS